MPDFFAQTMDLSSTEIALAQRYWECLPSARATGQTHVFKQKDRLSYLEVVSSWLSDFKPAITFAHSLAMGDEQGSGDDLVDGAIELSRKIVDQQWGPSDPSAPLRGNSKYSSLVQFTSTLLALQILTHENLHMGAADNVASECARARDRAKHWAKVKQWCAGLRQWLSTAVDLAIIAYDKKSLDKAKECVALVAKFPAPPGRKPAAQAAAEVRLRNAAELEEEDEDGFGPVRSELQGSPLTEAAEWTNAYDRFIAAIRAADDQLLDVPPDLRDRREMSDMHKRNDYVSLNKCAADIEKLVQADADDAGSETGDEQGGRASPTYDMSGAAGLVPAAAPPRPPTPPEFYEGFAADGYSQFGADDEPPVAAPAATSLGKRKAEKAAKDTGGVHQKQKCAEALAAEEAKASREAEHAALLDTRTALAYALVAYGGQLHKLQCAGPRFEPNLGWASQEVFEIAKQITAAKAAANGTAAGSSGV